MLLSLYMTQHHPLYSLSHVPDVTFKTQTHVEGSAKVCMGIPFDWVDVTTAELFDNKKVVVFSLPGAFTPTCSGTHAPGYDAAFAEFKALGIDEVICVSVNDAFVMSQWGKHLDIKNVRMLPDGNGEFTRKMGMLVKKENLGFGERSWRYSMYVENGEIKKMFIEDGFGDNTSDDPFAVSDAKTMLEYLKSKTA